MTQKTIPVPSAFPKRIFFNRDVRTTKKGGIVYETVCNTYEDNHAAGKSCKSAVVRIGVIKSESGYGEIEFSPKFLLEHSDLIGLRARRVDNGKRGRNSVEFFLDDEDKPVAGKDKTLHKQRNQSAISTATGQARFLREFFERSISGQVLKSICQDNTGLYHSLLSLLSFITAEGMDKLSEMEQWAQEHSLTADDFFSQDGINRILSSIDADFMQEFYRIKDTLLSNREQAQGSAAADHQMLALYAAGRSDGDPGLLALLAEKSQELCWHQSVTGETNAAGLLEAALKNCRDYKGEDIMLVADSKSRNIRNVALCYDRKVPFLLQASLQSAVLKKHILDRAANLSMGNGCIKIECENNYCFGIKIGREFSWTRTADRQKQRSKIWLYLFFTPALQSKAMGRYYDKMKQLNDLLYRHKQAISQAISSHRKKPAEPRLPAELQKLIDEQVLTYNPDTDDFRLNPAESLPRQILESSMILLSSEDMDVEQAYRLYQEGNIIGDINLHTARLQPQDNCEALQFMALLAAEGLRQIRHNLEACNEGKSGTKQMVLQDNSVRQMLRMLDNTENPAESRRLMTALYKANGI